MKRSHILPLLALVAVSVCATAAAPIASPLRALTQRDQDKVDATGCVFQFESKRNVLFYAIENTLTVRTKAGASLCKIPEATFGTFRDAKGSLSCGGQRLRLKPIGKQIDDEAADGSSQPSALTVGEGRTAIVIRGEVATAC